jgi:hypothetical protein
MMKEEERKKDVDNERKKEFKRSDIYEMMRCNETR